MSDVDYLNQEDLQTAVHEALVNWGKPFVTEVAPLSNLLLVQNKLTQNEDVQPMAMGQAIDRLLLESLEHLAEQDETSAKVLESRFLDGKITRQVAHEMHASPDQVNRWQRTALSHLTKIIYHQEKRIRAEKIQELEGYLPPSPYNRFFGFSQTRQAVLAQLKQLTAPWMIAITGIGGIGKTSLADNIVRQIMPGMIYKQIYWLRVENQQMSGGLLSPERAYDLLLSGLAEQLWPKSPIGDSGIQLENRLRQQLKEKPHLIVVDNLETTAHIDYFAAKLFAFTEPSRFLLTSRARPTGATAVYIHSIHELPLDDAAALLRHHAENIGFVELAQADEKTIRAIYEITGGNPLALKLVVSLAAVLPLPQILADLHESRSGPIEDLYRHIYWEAWRALTPQAQSLLQAMPLVASTGALPEQMQAICGLDDDDFWAAIRELTSRSLLEVQGTLLERRYGIHRLTETFLHTEIIRWPEMMD